MSQAPALPQYTPNSSQPVPKEKSFPWQYVGYPGLSEWMPSSGDFFVLRRFSKVNTRYLLYLQHEIAKREQRLEEMDEDSRNQPPGDAFGATGSFDREVKLERTKLIIELGERLKQYYDHVNAYSQVRAKRTADQHHLRELKNWFRSNNGAIVKNECHFWDYKRQDSNGDPQIHDGDIFEMISYPKTPLRWFLNKSKIMRLFFELDRHGKMRSDRVKSTETRYYSNAGFDQFLCLVTVAVGLGLLFAPMWYLHSVQNPELMLGTITGFVGAFAFWLWVAAGPRQFEILLGTAAYAAVLYIYLQAAKGPPHIKNTS